MPIPLIPIAIGAVAAVVAWNNRREIQGAVKQWSESESGKQILGWLKSFGDSMVEIHAEKGRAREAVELLLSKKEEERRLLLQTMTHEAPFEKVKALQSAAEESFAEHPQVSDLLKELSLIVKAKKRQHYVNMLKEDIDKAARTSNQ